jgi:hypothetical protein
MIHTASADVPAVPFGALPEAITETAMTSSSVEAFPAASGKVLAQWSNLLDYHNCALTSVDRRRFGEPVSRKYPTDGPDPPARRVRESIREGKHETRSRLSGFVENWVWLCYAACDMLSRKLSATCLAMKISGRIHGVERARSTTLSIFNIHLFNLGAIQWAISDPMKYTPSECENRGRRIPPI